MRPDLRFALIFGLVFQGAASHAASIVPSETFCEHGCDFPQFDQLAPEEDPALPMLENPLREISPFQDFLGEVGARPETDTDSEWESPTRRPQN